MSKPTYLMFDSATYVAGIIFGLAIVFYAQPFSH